MATIKKRETKDGCTRYDVTVCRDGIRLTKTYIPWPDMTSRELRQALKTFTSAVEKQLLLSEEELKAKKEKQKQKEKEPQEEPSKAMPTIQEYITSVWLPEKQLQTAEHTRSFYSYICRGFIIPDLGIYRFDELTPADLRRLFIEYQQRTPPLSHRTIIGVYDTLSQIVKSALLADIIDRNPLEKVPRPKRKKDLSRPEVDSYTLEELQEIIDALDSEPLKWRVYVCLLTETGIRRGEACGLTWDCVDLRTGKVIIKQGLCYTSAAGTYTTTTKNGRERAVYVTAGTAELLRKLKREQAATVKRRIKRAKKDGKRLTLEQRTMPRYIFTARGTGAPMHPTTPTYYLARFGRAHGIKRLHPHKLRHTFASLAITHGADVASVSELLGHADKATTLRLYTHADEESKRKAAGVVASALYNLQ